MAADQGEYAFRLRNRDVVATALYRVIMPAIWLVYAFALGAAKLRPVLFLVMGGLAVLAVPVGLASTWLAVTGPTPALTAEGIWLQTGRFRRVALLPWSHVHLVWVDTYRGSRNLGVLPRSQRSHRVSYLPLPGGRNGTEGLGELIRTLSGGEVDLADHGPEDDWVGIPRGFRMGPQYRRRPPLRTVPARRIVPSVLVLLLLLPAALALPEAWNQPWWPVGQRALEAPDPCAQLDPDLAAGIVGRSAARHTVTGTGGERSCAVDGNGATLTVTYSVHTALLGSSVRKAKDYVQIAVAAAQMDRLASDADVWIADYAGFTPDSSLVYGMPPVLIGRRANVVVEITYTGESGPDVVRPAVIAIGTRAIAAIRYR